RSALHLDQTHAAVAGDRQTLVETETRHFRAGLLRSLQQRVVIGDFDLFAVYLNFSHIASTPRKSAKFYTGRRAVPAVSSSTKLQRPRLLYPTVAPNAARKPQLLVEQSHVGVAQTGNLRISPDTQSVEHLFKLRTDP